MNTRYADPGATLSSERYMSAAEFAELRGLNGMAVAAKAMLVRSPEKRSLLMFLMARSWTDGGLVKVAEELFEMFPERIGTPAMLKAGLKRGQHLSDAVVEELLDEISPLNPLARLDVSREEIRARETERVKKAPHTSDYYLDSCGDAEKLAEFLTELCINPTLLLRANGESAKDYESDKDAVVRASPGAKYHWSIKKADFKGFHDLCGALFEYRRRCKEKALTQFAKTNTARKVIAVLDACHKAKRMGLIEGNSDAGKSVPAEAWSRAHCGEVIYVRLTGVTSKTSFFRALGRELGIGGIYSRSSTEMQARVEDILIRLKLTVVIDEDAYMFPQAQRIYSRPELPDWIYTTLSNHGVPVILIATSMFSERMRQAERQVTWNSQQFRRRLYRFERGLPAPSRRDIELVASYHAPDASAAVVAALTDYAMLSKPSDVRNTWQPLTDVVDTILDARQMAQTDGRETITVKDVHAAIREFRAPTASAKFEAFDAPNLPVRRKRIAPALPTDRSEPAQEVQEESSEDFQGQRAIEKTEEVPAISGRSRSFQVA